MLTLDGEVGSNAAPEMERVMEVALQERRRDLVLDLRGLRSLDGAMLRVLNRGLKRARAREGRLALVRPRTRVWRVIVLTGLNRHLPAFDRVGDALTSFASSPRP